jgi:hypothetical protein
MMAKPPTISTAGHTRSPEVTRSSPTIKLKPGMAKDEECSFLDRHGRMVNWKLVAIKDIREFSLENGALLFSQVKEVEPVAAPVWAL